MKRKLFTLGLLLIGVMIYAQEVKISGKVTDPAGEPIVGANVIEKGTTNGTITNADGIYELEVKQDATLVFSFIGYARKEVPMAGQTSIDVSLQEEAVSMDELVVTALGITQAKKAVGYAVQEVETEQLTKVNSQNLGNLLTGKVAGLRVDNPTGIFQSPNFSLRGKKPLIVVDNIPVSTDFFDLSKNDIETITVLKGTAASALYGTRGRNGAILITTKRAESKGYDINIRNSTMVTAGFTVFPETQTEYGNGSLGQYEFWDGKDGGISDGDMIWGPKFSDNLLIPQWNSPIVDNVTGEEIPWWGDVAGTKYDDKSRYSRKPIPWEYNNNLKDFLRTGVVTTTDFSIGYKDEKLQYRFSGNYSHQRGQVPNSSLQTGGATFTSSFDLHESVRLDNKISYNKVYSPNYPRYGYGPKNHIYTILIWMGDDVNGQDLSEHYYVPGQEGYRQANFNYAWYNNVYFAANELNQEFNKDIVNGQLNLTWDITNDLSLQLKNSAIRSSRFMDRESPKSYLNYGDPRDGDYKTWNTGWLSVDNEIRASFKKQVSSAINLTLNAGGANFYHKYENYYNATDGIVVPWVYSLNNTKGNVKGSTDVQQIAIRSAYATMNLDLIDAFFFTFSGRSDWASDVPESQNPYFYPSMSLSTMVSNLINLPSEIDYLKVFGAWASVRSNFAAPDEDADAGYKYPYEISPFYTNSGSYNGLPRLSYPGIIINPALAPEISISYEVGLSLGLLKNRIGLDFAYYNTLDKDHKQKDSKSLASGFEGIYINGNEYTTNGVEIGLNTMPVLQNNFRWNLMVNWDRRVTKLTKITTGEEKFNNLSEGERVDNYYSTGWLKSPDGQVILSEETGMPTKDPFPQMFGHRNPDFRFGVSNRFSYKKLTLGLDFDGIWGGVIRSLSVEKMWWGGKHPNSTTYRDDEKFRLGEPNYVPEGVNVTSGELVTDVNGNVISDTRVFKENTTAVNWQTWCQNYPYRAKVTEEENETFANVFDRSFIKLRNVSLTYDISDLIRIGDGMELTVFGYNLLMWKKAQIIDPDYGNDDNLQDPSARYVGMSVNLKF